jgi:arylsulfatase A-like enzyme
VWIHYQDPHGPYTPPAELRERYLPIEREAHDGRRMLPVKRGAIGIGGIPKYQYIEGQREVAFYRAGYDAEVRYMDEELGRFLAGLEERGLTETALIVFAADHGESLGEANYWFAHGDFLGEVLVRVPFLVRIPGRAPERRDDVVSLVDLYGTFLRQLTGEADLPTHRGRDLLAEGAAESASTPYLDTRGASRERRYGIVDGEYKWVVSERGDVSIGTLFWVGQPGKAIESEDPEVRRALSEQLDALMRGFDRDVPETRQQLTDADREMLNALGYGRDSRDPEGEVQ